MEKQLPLTPRNTIHQMWRYALVTLITYAVDAGLLFVFTEYVFAGLVENPHLVAQVISNPLAGLVNYALSSTPLVFGRTRHKSQVTGFLLFTIIGVGNLLINLFCLWLFTDIIGLYFMLSKVIGLVAGFLWNFYMRRLIVFRHNPAENL